MRLSSTELEPRRWRMPGFGWRRDASPASERATFPRRGLVWRAGNVADLVIVHGNAGDDIGALDHVETVVVGGSLYEREDLLARAKDLASRDLPHPN